MIVRTICTGGAGEHNVCCQALLLTAVIAAFSFSFSFYFLSF